jgi:predicted ABC-type ATPase
VIAGPNGSGKSTFFAQHLATSGLLFVNADLIAAELDEPDDLTRARLAADLAGKARETLVAQRRSFITETVLSDPFGDKVAKFASARDQGYFLDVHFIGLASPELSQARVIDRVSRGGHDVPDDRIFGRYPRTLRNLTLLLDVADRLSIYDNSELDRPHRLVAVLERGVLLRLSHTQPAWLEIIGLTTRRTTFTQRI